MKKILFLSLIGLLLVGCGPVKLEMVEEIKPNETAYLIDLENGDQGKFQSIEYLESKRVSAKRILLPQRQQNTGRMPGSYRWIPTARVIKVDRSLVSRKWVGTEDANLPNKIANDPAIAPLVVESQDSIGFSVGVTITARIDEKDASTYLYYHNPKQLSEVIDTNIKSFILTKLSTEFGALPLTQCRTQKNTIMARVTQECKDFFKLKGITIEYMGLSEGLNYQNPEIQKSIDNSFVAQQSKITAQQEQEAQAIKNQTLIQKVAAESKAANELAANLNAAMAKQRVEIEVMKAKAQLTMAEKWNGQLPTNIIPSNNPFLTQLFGSQSK